MMVSTSHGWCYHCSCRCPYLWSTYSSFEGDYLAIATLGMAEIIRIIIVNGGELTNGAAGLTEFFLIQAGSVIYFFEVIITILVLNFAFSDWSSSHYTS